MNYLSLLSNTILASISCFGWLVIDNSLPLTIPGSADSQLLNDLSKADHQVLDFLIYFSLAQLVLLVPSLHLYAKLAVHC